MYKCKKDLQPNKDEQVSWYHLIFTPYHLKYDASNQYIG